jgi:transcriptional antiterminator RfaH
MPHEWFVARTKPLLEAIAEERLQNQGFTTYLPLLTSRVPHRGRVIERRAPLFRSYLFVKLDLSESGGETWRMVNSTRAVQSLLPRPEAPKSIAAGEIERLAEFELEGYFRKGMILPGDRIRVYRGTLAGQVLTCIERRRDCVVALWACLNSETRVILRAADVGVYS